MSLKSVRYNGIIPSIEKDNITQNTWNIELLRQILPPNIHEQHHKNTANKQYIRTNKEVPQIVEDSNMLLPENLRQINIPTLSTKDIYFNTRYVDDKSKYTALTELYPENTCKGYNLDVGTYKTRIIPDENSFLECLRTKEQLGISIAINLTFGKRSNLLWFDTIRKVINRYEPNIAGNSEQQAIIDDDIRDYFGSYLPDYTYIGNTLSPKQCIKITVIPDSFMSYSDEFCQDYSLLYFINRVNGMSHEEAAQNLASKGQNIIKDVEVLLNTIEDVIKEVTKQEDKLYNHYGQ